MAILRTSIHPESARHQLQVRTEAEGARVVLVEWERPRQGGSVISETESCLLPIAQARALAIRARHQALANVPDFLRAASPRHPRKSTPQERTKVSHIKLTQAGLEALEWLVQWLADNGEKGEKEAGRSRAVELAVREAASSRGWKPPEAERAG